MNSDQQQQVTKTPEEHYNASLTNIIDQVDLLKHQALINPEVYTLIGGRLQAWGVKLFPKMNEEEKETFMERITIINNTSLYVSATHSNYGSQGLVIDKDYIPRFRSLLMNVEVFLMGVMERTGLTNPTKQMSKRVR